MNQNKLSHADYLDGFSTLFAVKGPRHPPGYDRRVAPIEQLLGEVVGGATGDDDCTSSRSRMFSLRTDRPSLCFDSSSRPSTTSSDEAPRSQDRVLQMSYGSQRISRVADLVIPY